MIWNPEAETQAPAPEPRSSWNGCARPSRGPSSARPVPPRAPRRRPRRARSTTSPGLPVHAQARSARALSVRPVRRAAADSWPACTPRRAPRASRRSSATPPSDLDVWREAMARVIVRGRRAPRRPAPRRLRLRALHGRARLSRRRRADRHDGRARVLRQHRAAISCSRTSAARSAATPSFALHIAETLAEQGSDPRALGLRYGMFGAEPWTEGIRAALERAFGLQAYDIYGLSRDHRPRRGRRVRAAGRPAHRRRSFPAGDRRSRHRRAAAARA